MTDEMEIQACKNKLNMTPNLIFFLFCVGMTLARKSQPLTLDLVVTS